MTPFVLMYPAYMGYLNWCYQIVISEVLSNPNTYYRNISSFYISAFCYNHSCAAIYGRRL